LENNKSCEYPATGTLLPAMGVWTDTITLKDNPAVLCEIKNVCSVEFRPSLYYPRKILLQTSKGTRLRIFILALFGLVESYIQPCVPFTGEWSSQIGRYTPRKIPHQNKQLSKNPDKHSAACYILRRQLKEKHLELSYIYTL
jgi:hypothetical protein